MNRWLTLGLALAALLALALRLPLLDQRPLHNDEAVNAIKFGQLWEEGSYQYDPNEHHGPTLIYATYALSRLTGAPDFDHLSETRLRMVTVLFGVGLILILPLVVDGLGRRAMLWAAFLTALSPAMAFYSRYYIHELILVFSAFLAIGAAWRYWRSRQLGWALLAGAAAGLMHATKETFVISLVAVGLALAANQIWNRWFDASGSPSRAQRIIYWHLAAGFGIWLLVALALFSSFFTNAGGPLDSIRTYAPWLQRAGGDSPHIHPWYYYFRILTYFHPGPGPVFTEALILLLALIGGAAGFIRKRLGQANASFLRFLALYTFALSAGYSIISYKTPWCLLNFWHGMILLAGVGAVVLLRSLRPRLLRFAVAALLATATLHLAWQAWQADVPFAADQRNPYVYAHTSPDITRLNERLELLAKASPEGKNMLVKVIGADGDYWPLPWYLRSFNQVGFWDSVPPDPYAPVMIVSSALEANLDERGLRIELKAPAVGGGAAEAKVGKWSKTTWEAVSKDQPIVTLETGEGTITVVAPDSGTIQEVLKRNGEVVKAGEVIGYMARKKTHLMTGHYQLRPDTHLELYVRLDLWKAFLAQNPPKQEE